MRLETVFYGTRYHASQPESGKISTGSEARSYIFLVQDIVYIDRKAELLKVIMNRGIE